MHPLTRRPLLGALALLTLATLVAAPATARAFGLGIIAGEPTGLSYKNWVSGRHAVDAAAAWSFADEDALHLHADYLWHFDDRVEGVEGGRLPLYVGVGGRVKLGDRDDDIGVRIPFGAAFNPNDAPIDVFLEIVPVLDLAPDTELEINAAIGVRYWFSSSSSNAR